jgi:2-(1,2-epoxy-1,2-dihydrophenyl)acetyl-CoA isomerase
VGDATNFESSTVKYIKNGAVCRIELNRASKLNALNLNTLERLLKCLHEARDSKEVRVLVLTGVGRAFCVGADLQEAVTFRGTPNESVLESHYRPIIQCMRGMPKPIVCAVNGIASGAGCALGLAADVILASKSTQFKFPFSNLGLIPDSGSTWLLTRLIGEVRAKNLFMTAGSMSAEQALAWGAVTEVVEDCDLQRRADDIAQQLSESAPLALSAIKSVVHASYQNDLSTQLRLEETTQEQLIKTNDVVAGFMGFMSQTTPSFSGT